MQPLPSRAAAIALVAGAPFVAARRAAAQAAPPVRLGTGLADSYAGPFYAADGGFFSRSGLDVPLTILANSGAIAQAAVGGAVDVGVADLITIAHAQIAGVPLACFFGGGLYLSEAPTTLALVAKNSPFRSPKELEGQTVAVVALASISLLGMREWLRQGGVDLAKVRIVEMPFPDMVPAMQRGQVAAALVAEPYVASTKNDARVLGKAFDAIAKSFYISAYFASKDWLAKNADAARKLVAAIGESARWANGHRDDTATILAKYTKMTPDRIASMTRVSQATALDARRIQPVLDVAYRYGQLERPVTATDIMYSVR
jgi:NitT/TauT family transport system substrate-binding protein